MIQHRVYIFAHPRSGRHAIMNWLAKHYGSYFVFDTSLHAPYSCAMPAECPELLMFNLDSDTSWTYANALFDPTSDFRKWESKKLADTPSWLVRLLILRDPYNAFASQLRLGNLTERTYKVATAQWKELAREYLGTTNRLRGAIALNYNFWFSSIEYREEVAARFDKPLCDEAINDVPVGKDSAFDARRYSAMAQQMLVLHRWEQMRDHPFMRRLMSDRSVGELSDAIWNGKHSIL